MITSYRYLNRQISKKIKKLDKYLHDKATYDEFIDIKQGETLIKLFLILMKKDSNIDIICIPNIGSYYSKLSDSMRSTLIIELSNNMESDYIMSIPINMKDELNKCKKKKKQFIIITLLINFRGVFEHLNVIIIDLYNNTIERFEPYGQSLPTISNYRLYEKIIYNNLIYFKNNYLDSKFKYIYPSEISPVIGIQSKAEFTEKGRKCKCLHNLCLIWSIMYLHLRILNPHLKPDKIVKILLDYSMDELKDISYKYIKFIKNTLKQ